ncbi:MAG: LuxR C-terminal-related transcriptional regulator [Candidatus Dormibacteraeota bacterium]|nr:LuxR C-terminal-related transcriptional regulator [Candidatus Dormibacteraeota bacterium]
MSESLPVLAGVLRTTPESNALVILGRLLDSLPISVLLTDCSEDLRCVYANAAWRASIQPEMFPIEGQSLLDILEGLGASQLLPILRQVCVTGTAAHLRDFEYVGLVGAPVTLPGDVTVWDWEVYPLTDAVGVHGHLLVVGMDATERALQGPGVSPETRQRAAEMQERASGILRIFGVAPGTEATPSPAQLTRREQEVADLVASGLSNAAVANQLFLSPATVASHVSRILGKLGFKSRVEVAAWIVERRLRSEAGGPPD